MITVTAILASLLFVSANAVAVPTPRAECKSFAINGTAGAFTSRTFADFSNNKVGDNAASVLRSYGIGISNYPITAGPVPRTFVPGNVAFGAGTLDLKVSRYSGSGAIQSAEIITDDTFMYGSVRVVYQVSSTPGVCEGNFFYLNDNQEVDWEVLTSTIFTSNPNVPAGIWATSQAPVGGTKVTNTVPFSFDPRTSFHEYRIDWTAGGTTFYIDGVQKAKHTKNMPTQATHWMFNVWSNGDANWSNGPPTADSITKIRSIDIYKGYVPKASADACAI